MSNSKEYEFDYLCAKAGKVVKLKFWKQYGDESGQTAAKILKFNCTGMYTCGVMREESDANSDQVQWPDLSLCVCEHVHK
jgi:hypothetical protein